MTGVGDWRASCRVKVLVLPASETAAPATLTAVCSCFLCLLPVFNVCISGAC